MNYEHEQRCKRLTLATLNNLFVVQQCGLISDK
jgi:hypothetical protein